MVSVRDWESDDEEGPFSGSMQSSSSGSFLRTAVRADLQRGNQVVGGGENRGGRSGGDHGGHGGHRGGGHGGYAGDRFNDYDHGSYGSSYNGGAYGGDEAFGYGGRDGYGGGIPSFYSGNHGFNRALASGLVLTRVTMAFITVVSNEVSSHDVVRVVAFRDEVVVQTMSPFLRCFWEQVLLSLQQGHQMLSNYRL
ncbi:uncharacterized protein LOC133928056 [Phragmites australis]|uniref:uncharacterized protein LOC133928056 n=1 Tax=Phragmites australis TaxID=29695 RepID=UPI002D79ED88|nr:uncharacterized protein LOC133928056 [Phragmites australis]